MVERGVGMFSKKGKDRLGSRLDQMRADIQDSQSQAQHVDHNLSDDDEYDLSEKDKDLFFNLGVVGTFLATFLFAAYGLGVFGDGLSHSPSKVTGFLQIIPDQSKVLEPFEKEVFQLCAPNVRKENDFASSLYEFNSMPTLALMQERKAYLICGMGNEVERFCYSSFREQLAQQLKVYISAKRRMIKNFERMMKSPRNRMIVKFAEVLSENGTNNGIETGGLRMSAELKKSLDPRLGTAFHELMKQGYISRHDFGWFGAGFPEELAPFVPDGMSQTATPCDG